MTVPENEPVATRADGVATPQKREETGHPGVVDVDRKGEP